MQNILRLFDITVSLAARGVDPLPRLTSTNLRGSRYLVAGLVPREAASARRWRKQQPLPRLQRPRWRSRPLAPPRRRCWPLTPSATAAAQKPRPACIHSGTCCCRCCAKSRLRCSGQSHGHASPLCTQQQSCHCQRLAAVTIMTQGSEHACMLPEWSRHQ